MIDLHFNQSLAAGYHSGSQMFVAVAVLVYVFIVIRDTCLYIKNP